MDVLENLLAPRWLAFLVPAMNVADRSSFLITGIGGFGNFLRLFREVRIHRLGH
jgi:hypothetical protein